jgi:hypothetical protein
MVDGIIERIEKSVGVPSLADILADRVAPTDLQSLMLEVYARAADKISPKRLLEQYEKNRFVSPSLVDPRIFVEVDRLAWRNLPREYRAVELSPLCPLGTISGLASVHQNKVVTTARNTEVVADATNVLALECATQRRRLLRGDRPRDPVLLAASHRHTRAQALSGPRMFAHFRILGMCAAGRDEGDLGFESRHLVEQIAFYARLVRELASIGLTFTDLRVAITDLSGGIHQKHLEEGIAEPLSKAIADGCVHFDPLRTSGRGYYQDVCFKLFARDRQGDEIEIGDGGPTPWTQRLLSDGKERLVISGLGVERLCAP